MLSLCSWQNALRIVALLVLITCFCGALMRPLKPTRELPKPREKNVLDRLVEQTKAKIGLKRSDSIYSDTTSAKVNGDIAEVQTKTASHEYGYVPGRSPRMLLRIHCFM